MEGDMATKSKRVTEEALRQFEEELSTRTSMGAVVTHTSRRRRYTFFWPKHGHRRLVRVKPAMVEPVVEALGAGVTPACTP
jgi:hypothetical protein